MKLSATVTMMGICMASCLTARASYPVVCSAFNGAGTAATVTVAAQKMTLQISLASGGEPLSLSTRVSESGVIGCKSFFDRSGQYIAVGLGRTHLDPGPLHVIVADLRAKKLIGDFAVKPQNGLEAPLNLAGFLRDEVKLVVLGSGTAKVFSTLVVGITGETVNPPERRTLPDNAGSVGNISFADAVHNRLWFKSSPQFCPLRSAPLVGNGPEKAVVDENSAKSACDVVSAIAYPSQDVLITAVTREPGDLVTRVDLAQRKVDEIVLPSAGGRGHYTSVGRGVLSADGEVFAIVRILLANSPLGDAHSYGTELDVVQVSPLKIIGKVRLKPDTDPASISIDHRNGAVEVLSFEDNKWKSAPLQNP